MTACSIPQNTRITWKKGQGENTIITVSSLTRRTGGVDHKLFIDNFTSFPDVFYDLLKRVNCYSTVTSNHKGMPQGLFHKILKLERGDL
jgi:hypothetical protein